VRDGTRAVGLHSADGQLAHGADATVGFDTGDMAGRLRQQRRRRRRLQRRAIEVVWRRVLVGGSAQCGAGSERAGGLDNFRTELVGSRSLCPWLQAVAPPSTSSCASHHRPLAANRPPG